MATAPLELILVRFPKNQLKGEILEELERLTKEKIIRVIDILFVIKDKRGDITVAEMSDLEDDDHKVFEVIVSELAGVLNEKDAQELAREMKSDSSAALMLFEHSWAAQLRESIMNAGGELLASERIPGEAVEQLRSSE